jgi:hypothetical protein
MAALRTGCICKIKKITAYKKNFAKVLNFGKVDIKNLHIMEVFSLNGGLQIFLPK